MSDDAPAVGLVGDDVGGLRELLVDDGIEVAVRGLSSGDPSADDPSSGDAAVDATAADAASLDAATLDAIVAVGQRAVADVAATAPSAPIVPVDAGAGIRSVPTSAVDAIPAAIRAGDWATEIHTPLSVAVGDDVVGTATYDVTLVTAEAAHISEYAVVVDGDGLDRTRADGVVVATAAGSTDYARRVDAPVVAPETGVAVAWIAPFRTDPDRWVVRPSTLSIRIEREEAAVDLYCNDRGMGSVAPDEVVSLSPAAPVTVAVLDVARGRYG